MDFCDVFFLLLNPGVGQFNKHWHGTHEGAEFLLLNHMDLSL
jgi:hypothetical protein